MMFMSHVHLLLMQFFNGISVLFCLVCIRIVFVLVLESC